MGKFVRLHGLKYIFVSFNYVLKWVEVVALSNNEDKNIKTFLKENKFS